MVEYSLVEKLFGTNLAMIIPIGIYGFYEIDKMKTTFRYPLLGLWFLGLFVICMIGLWT